MLLWPVRSSNFREYCNAVASRPVVQVIHLKLIYKGNIGHNLDELMHWYGKGTDFANRLRNCHPSSDEILRQKGRGSAEKERKKKRIV